MNFAWFGNLKDKNTAATIKHKHFPELFSVLYMQRALNATSCPQSGVFLAAGAASRKQMGEETVWEGLKETISIGETLPGVQLPSDTPTGGWFRVFCQKCLLSFHRLSLILLQPADCWQWSSGAYLIHRSHCAPVECTWRIHRQVSFCICQSPLLMLMQQRFISGMMQWLRRRCCPRRAYSHHCVSTCRWMKRLGLRSTHQVQTQSKLHGSLIAVMPGHIRFTLAIIFSERHKLICENKLHKHNVTMILQLDLRQYIPHEIIRRNSQQLLCANQLVPVTSYSPQKV